MGKRKKGYNWKARQQVETHIDHSEESKIKLDHSVHNNEGYDDSNALVLPAKKRKTKVKHQDEQTTKLLSRKQRKRLEKIVEQKEKKAKRASLLESLKDVQATKEEISLFTSTTEMHSQKFKKSVDANRPIDNSKTNAISGSNKKKGQLISNKSDSESEESSSEEETSSEEEEEKEEEIVTKDVEEMLERSQSKENANDNQIQKPKDTIQKSAEKKENVTERKPAIHVALDRDPDIQESRLKLPILAEEQIIMEAINENPVVILCGETGSGKTTQVPQFLYEAGYAHKTKGIIGVTEPRRVAAISMSKRVGQEMGLTSREVSYQIRYEGNTTDDTKVKFMTDGVLLKEVQKDFMLTKYSVIIIDEAHERSVYTDILIGLLSRIGPLREKKGNPLKLIIMSATLRVEDFTQNPRLFKITPPVIKVDSRQFPVTIHFNKKTPTEDYLGETFKKICKIHKQLPNGGILVFVTGQQEVRTLCAKLRRAFPFSKNGQEKQQETGTTRRKRQHSEGDNVKPELPKVNLDDYSVLPLDEEAEMQNDDIDSKDELSDDAEVDEDDMDVDNERSETKFACCSEPLHVLPLYSLLPSHKQSKVFEPPPEGSRLCVIATNVAETSLTIPNIKYVVDTGKVKTKFYDKVTGVSTFKVTWTSKAGANQRAGRAGRMGAGHCYRLYSSAVFNDDFEQFSPPEIARRPVDDLVLQMKDMGIDKVVNFPFPTPPDFDALRTAEKLLVSLGALEKPPKPKSYKEAKKNDTSTRITPLGKAMACFPVSPRYGKMLSVGHQHYLLPYVIAIVAALSVQEVLESTVNPANSEVEKEEQNLRKTKISQIRKTWAGVGESLLLGDLTVLLKAVGACEYAGLTQHFCEKHGIRYKAMTEVRKLRVQLTNAVNAVISDAAVVIDPKMDPPDELQTKLLRQVVLSGMGDHVARKMPAPLPGAEDAKKFKYAYQSMQLEEPVYIHPGSVLFKGKVEYVIYQHIDETSKMYMKGVSAIEPEWLPSLVSSHCQFSKPLEEPPPSYNEDTGTVVCLMSSTFGPCNWQIPAVELEYPDGLEKYKLFAKFLLEGKVFKPLKKYTPHLLSTPSTMIKSWAKLKPRTEQLLQALIEKQIDSKSVLTKVWQKDSQYLLSAYAAWIPQSLHGELKQLWPPL